MRGCASVAKAPGKAMTDRPEPRPRLAVSACLMGEAVRYDGGHKRNAFVAEVLGTHFDLIPVCPEAAIGLGTPREPIRLVKKAGAIHAVGVRHADRDVTTDLGRYGAAMASELDGISGYVFKSGSPSCGMARVKVYEGEGAPSKEGVGVYARAIMERHPLLPVEEEGRLNDSGLRASFLTRVAVYNRWQHLCTQALTPARLIAFHTAHKFLLLAGNESAYRRLGRLVAGAGSADLDALKPQYIHEVMTALKRPPGRGQHANVLQHLSGWLRRHLDAGDRQELARLIDDYRRGLTPRAVPLALLKHHLRRHPESYLAGQHYLLESLVIGEE